MKELDKLQEAKARILSLIDDSDKENADNAIADLLSAQAQSDIEEVEIVVPSKSVVKTVDLGSVCLKKSTYGILFSCKGGLDVLISQRFKGLYDTLEWIMDCIDSDYTNVKPEEKDDVEAYSTAWLTILQAPLFCSLDPLICVEAANILVKSLNEYSEKTINEPLHEETIEDAAKNAEFRDEIDTMKE